MTLAYPTLSAAHIDIGSVWAFLNFVEQGRFVNLARVAPDWLEATYMIMHNEGKQWTLSIDGATALCVTVAIITGSSLTDVKSDSGNTGPNVPMSKHLQAIFPCQEFDRNASMVTMVFGFRVLHAQMNTDALTIGTRVVTASKLKDDWMPAGIQSASSSYRSTSYNTDGLLHTAEIPVYDGRNGTLEVYDTLNNVDQLP
ncbi:hypothetical protein C8R45DRAFT_1097455 [Mycena sanguinolenta]|nr:hypothetical protein C8R45DRAFT_1097455 [Mycena sanguinolenta]